MRQWLSVLFVSILLASCGQPAISPGVQETAPEEFMGAFLCSGYEAGLLASAGSLRINPDGSAAVEWMYAAEQNEGAWHYDSATGRVIFSANLGISHAEYDQSVDQLMVYLPEGVQRAHVETGVMYCLKP